jgi:hypothetical protein
MPDKNQYSLFGTCLTFYIIIIQHHYSASFKSLALKMTQNAAEIGKDHPVTITIDLIELFKLSI